MANFRENPGDRPSLQKSVEFATGKESEHGKTTLVIDSIETGSIEPGPYLYDFKITTKGNPLIVQTLARGKVMVIEDIAKLL